MLSMSTMATLTHKVYFHRPTINQSIDLCIFAHTIFMYLCTYLSFCLSACLPAFLPVCLSDIFRKGYETTITVDSCEGLVFGRLQPCLQMLDCRKSGKHSSLLQCSNNYCSKKFYCDGPTVPLKDPLSLIKIHDPGSVILFWILGPML